MSLKYSLNKLFWVYNNYFNLALNIKLQHLHNKLNNIYNSCRINIGIIPYECRNIYIRIINYFFISFPYHIVYVILSYHSYIIHIMDYAKLYN